MHSKTALNRPPRILCSENANSALKIKILHSKMEILYSENVNFAPKTAMVLQTDCPQFCAQKMEILHSKMEILRSKNEKFLQCHRKSTFLRKIGQFHATALKSKFCAN